MFTGFNLMKLMPIKLSGLLGAVLAVSLATGSAGQAQTGTDSQCKSPEYTAAKVEQIKRMVEGIRDAVELVPPEERNYIRAETKIAMDQQNEIRFNTVAKRPYYDYNPIKILCIRS